MKRDLLRMSAFGLLLFLLSSGAPAQQGAPPMATAQPATQVQGEEAPLTNADVVKLCKLDLGDEVVIAKINQAKAVNFNLDTDSLVRLREQGVSKEVVAAMLKRATPTPRPVPAAPSQGLVPGAAPGDAMDVRLSAKDGDTELIGHGGEYSTTMAVVTVLAFMDYPGISAKTRTTDRQPAFVLTTQEEVPQNSTWVVMADRDKKHNVRSVKVGRFGAAMFFGAGRLEFHKPDKDWTVPYDIQQEQPGVWRLTLKKSLKPGEYGVYHAGKLYDFGVD